MKMTQGNHMCIYVEWRGDKSLKSWMERYYINRDEQSQGGFYKMCGQTGKYSRKKEIEEMRGK